MNIVPHDTAQTHNCSEQAWVYKIAVVHLTLITWAIELV